MCAVFPWNALFGVAVGNPTPLKDAIAEAQFSPFMSLLKATKEAASSFFLQTKKRF